MKIIVVGAGAMGSLVGGLLAEKGADVTLYDVAYEHINTIRNKGLIIEYEGRRRVINVNATEKVKELGKADLLVVLVKSYDTGEALRGIEACLTSRTSVLTLQNGLGNIEAIREVVPPQQILAGVTSHGAMLLEPGMVRHNGGSKTYVGAVDKNERARAQWAARVLNLAGIETQVSEDIMGAVWTKLIVNAAINPLTAITGRFNGELVEDKDLLILMEAIVQEAVLVAKALDMELQHEDMFEYVQTICRVTAQNRSSMLMDIIRGRRTEINAINGSIVGLGVRYLVPTPVNRCMTHLVCSLEKKGTSQG
ncbi:MAG: ketopantoate reductase family protein [Bacillota bacterium]|jgi:2-dehydropantoate 2-reductase